MWIADKWKDYEVLDTSGGEKLERWGAYRLNRPDPQVIWDTPRGKAWRRPNAHYHRSSKGGGEWEFFDLPEEWVIHYRDLSFGLKPFSFKHTGLFPEQAVNWDWAAGLIRGTKEADPDRPVIVDAGLFSSFERIFAATADPLGSESFITETDCPYSPGRISPGAGGTARSVFAQQATCSLFIDVESSHGTLIWITMLR